MTDIGKSYTVFSSQRTGLPIPDAQKIYGYKYLVFSWVHFQIVPWEVKDIKEKDVLLILENIPGWHAILKLLNFAWKYLVVVQSFQISEK